MSESVIGSGGALSLTGAGAAGSVIDFSGTTGVLYLATTQVSSPFNITTTTTNGTISLVSDTIGATIMNFQPGTDGPTGDTIVVQEIQTLFADLDFAGTAAADLAAFANFTTAAAQASAEYLIAPSGAITDAPLTNITLSPTLAPVLDDIVDGIFGTLASVAGANLLMQFVTVTNPNSNHPVIDALITTSDSTVNPCFTAGTHILTPRGEIPVETLKIGDAIITHTGAEAPITWIGTRRLDITRHPRPETIRPIIIDPGALAEGVPARPLRLSPDHALYLDGLLVPVKTLINWTTIRPDTAAASVTYYHIALPAHAILFAEQAPAESFLDSGHRGAFDNAETALILHPDFMQSHRETASCAPLCEQGPAHDAIRARLAKRHSLPSCQRKLASTPF